MVATAREYASTDFNSRLLQEAAAHVQQSQLNLTLKREQRKQDAMRAGTALVVTGDVAL